MSKLYSGYKIAKMIAKKQIPENTYLFRYIDNERENEIFIVNCESIWLTKLDLKNATLTWHTEIGNSYFTDNNISFEIIEDMKVVYEYTRDLIQELKEFNMRKVETCCDALKIINNKISDSLIINNTGKITILPKEARDIIDTLSEINQRNAKLNIPNNKELKVGDEIVIRDDLKSGEIYNNNHSNVVENMTDYVGKIAKITSITRTNTYKLDVDNGWWTWSKEMFK